MCFMSAVFEDARLTHSQRNIAGEHPLHWELVAHDDARIARLLVTLPCCEGDCEVCRFNESSAVVNNCSAFLHLALAMDASNDWHGSFEPMLAGCACLRRSYPVCV
jgi:hypothetical protein